MLPWGSLRNRRGKSACTRVQDPVAEDMRMHVEGSEEVQVCRIWGCGTVWDRAD